MAGTYKETQTANCLYFSELDQIFHLFHLYTSVAQFSTNFCPKIFYLIRFELESVISLEIREGQNRMSEMFQYIVRAPSARRRSVLRPQFYLW